MSQEEEFSKWLRRPEKTFEENMKFAIKSWQAVEFTLTKKYEMVLQWLTEQKQLKNEQILEDDFKELLKLRAQPGLITHTVKKDFVEWMLEHAKTKSNDTRKWCTLLQLLVEFELLQDLYRMDYELQCRVYGEIFNSYEKFLLAQEQNDKQFISTNESEFFALVLKSLKEIIKRCGDAVLFEKAYTAFALQPMAQVLLILRTFKIDFFKELLDIESLMCDTMKDQEMINRIFKLDLPIKMLCLECAIVKRRGLESFYKSLLNHVFRNFLRDSFEDLNPSLLLTEAAFVLEMLGRHDVSLNIQMNENKTAVTFLGEQIFAAVKKRKHSYLKEVLMLLCAALRLNPLLLEQNVFEVTARMILASKSGNKEEQELFEEYLVLLMDMFRRLSRAEKFVTNLLKVLNEQLKKVDLCTNKKRKAKMDLELEEPQIKKINLEETKSEQRTMTDTSKYLNILFEDFFKPTIPITLTENNKITSTTSFASLQNFWPSNPVGLSFSKLITGLVSKPSLTIWKTLLFALKELIESLNNVIQIDENSLFKLDFQTALLSQYFAGCKLVEQADKFLVELKQQREFTFEVLRLFGQFLLKREHQPRTMSAFLELAYYCSNFELLLTYYCPDGCKDESLEPLHVVERLHNFLTPEEWTLLQQRVLNFGKSACKHLLHRLKMQKSQAIFLLLLSGKENLCLIPFDPETLNYLLRTPQAKWYLHQLQRNEKVTIAEFIITKSELLPLNLEDLELLEFVSLAAYENICKTLNSKHSLLKSLSFDFNKARQCVEISAYELLIKELIDVVIKSCEGEYKVKKLPLEDIKTYLDILSRLPLSQLRRQRKTLIFALHLCLYRDLKAAQEEELAIQALDILKGLVSKPSLTIWKTLLFALKELIESLNNVIQIDENSLFKLDFQTALLSQYFAGCKLVEQADKFLVELKQQREFTFEVLRLFGQFLLKREHQPRTMSAFLELAYYCSNFELLLTYYCPDGCKDESLEPLHVVERLHNFLTPEEWTLLQQRVLNFGKSACKHLLHRLKMQKSQAIFLLLPSGKENLCLIPFDPETLNYLLRTPQAKWYLHQLQRNEKVTIAEFIITKSELLPLNLEDLELLEFVSLAAYENICKTLNSKHSLLKSLSFDFNKARQCVEISAYELLIKELIDVVIKSCEGEYKVKKLPLEDIKTYLDILSRLPLSQLRRQRKTLIFALHLCLYRDLKAAQEEELAIQALDILKDLLHFGQQVLIFKYLPTTLLLKLIPTESCWELYDFLFSSIKNEQKGTEQFLNDLANKLTESHASTGIKEEERKLLLAAIETLTSLSGPSAKHMRKHLDIFLQIFSDYLRSHFMNASDGTSKKDKKFVQNTLAAFAPYASVVLTRATKAEETTKQTNNSAEAKDFKFEVDEDFRRISKIYIGHSMDYRNTHAVRLMQVAINHRELLHLDQDEIEFVLNNYWSQINADLKDDQEQQKICTKAIEAAVKMIIGNKTNEDLLLILKTIANNVEEKYFSNILRLLHLISKCPFSTIKGAIFNEQYKQVTVNITLRLSRDEKQHLNNYDLIINLLNCHQAVIDNKMIPISIDTMDSILSFLMDINIKKFPLNDTNLNDFYAVHLAMTEVCSSFIKYRHILLMDRVPQYMHILKDLLQAIVCFKSEREKATALPSHEIDHLSELALKLEALMHLIAQHRVGVKRVAPFVLTFIINLMVANKRPTTLYNKIKNHIENICYELIGICDHRVGRFILRCSNEAGRQLYELLVKDYQKYHKFKGKV